MLGHQRHANTGVFCHRVMTLPLPPETEGKKTHTHLHRERGREKQRAAATASQRQREGGKDRQRGEKTLCDDTGHRKHRNELVRAITGQCWYMLRVRISVTHQHMVVLGCGWHVDR